jgi:hypothetical protein
MEEEVVKKIREEKLQKGNSDQSQIKKKIYLKQY